MFVTRRYISQFHRVEPKSKVKRTLPPISHFFSFIFQLFNFVFNILQTKFSSYVFVLYFLILLFWVCLFVYFQCTRGLPYVWLHSISPNRHGFKFCYLLVKERCANDKLCVKGSYVVWNFSNYS